MQMHALLCSYCVDMHDVEVLCMILSPTLFMRQIANTFLMVDSNIIGLRFTHGPF